ncbi:MAG: 2-phosphosulfolactate phosphatase [Candidatus Bipolaricaulota bacterium]
MQIHIRKLVEGARRARGLTVVIDVFRAFSVACYVFANGAERILPVEKVNEAYRLGREHPEYVLIGERNGRKPENFDYGNSPAEMQGQDFGDKTVVQTTSAGTKGLLNVAAANEVITGSFVNLGAVVAYLRSRDPSKVTLVPLGWKGCRPAAEDDYCAKFIRARLQGQSLDMDWIRGQLREGSGSRFFDPCNQDSQPKEDFELATQLDVFDFIIRRNSSNEHYELRKEKLSFCGSAGK